MLLEMKFNYSSCALTSIYHSVPYLCFFRMLERMVVESPGSLVILYRMPALLISTHKLQSTQQCECKVNKPPLRHTIVIASPYPNAAKKKTNEKPTNKMISRILTGD